MRKRARREAVAFSNIDRFEATANPKAKRHYGNTPIDCPTVFLTQLATLGRPHAWMHYDDWNAVEAWLEIGGEEFLALFIQAKQDPERARYFAENY